jgi:hypothetical protein
MKLGRQVMHLPSSQASDPAQSAKMPSRHSLDNATASGIGSHHKALIEPLLH